MASDAALDRSSVDIAWDSTIDYKIVLFYKYVQIEDVEILKAKVEQFCTESRILGRILIAPEGVNGTFAGSNSSMDLFVSFMESDERFSKIDWKWSYCYPTGTYT